MVEKRTRGARAALEGGARDHGGSAGGEKLELIEREVRGRPRARDESLPLLAGIEHGALSHGTQGADAGGSLKG